MSFNQGSSFRPKLRDTRGLKRDGKNKIQSSIRRTENRESRLRPRSSSKPKREPSNEPIEPETKINQEDIRKKMQDEVGLDNDNLVISFCQNEDPGSKVKWELRETKTGDRRQLVESNPIPEELEETEKPKEKKKSKMSKNQKSAMMDFLKGKKRKDKSKYFLKDHVERVLLILAQKYILSYHDRIRREKEHEKLKKSIQKSTFEAKLKNLKNNFKESEENVQSLWESRLAQNKVTKYTTRVDFKYIDTRLKKIERIFDEKEFSLEVIDKARQGQHSLKDKVEANSAFFKEFQERFKKARLKVIETK